MFQTKFVGKFRTHNLCSVTFVEIRAIYKITLKILYSGAGHMKIWRMRVACWIPKVKIRLSEY